jgi:hypothetical protein
MSERWPGGLINQTAPVPSGSYASSAASGIWTMDQQAYWKQQGLWPIPGNSAPYIEDVFSTYLYTGNGASQTINNGIQLGNINTSGGSGYFIPASYAQASTGTAMDFGTGDYTIEFWYQGNPQTYGVMVEIFNTGAAQKISIQRNGASANAIFVEVSSIRITTSGATPWDGNWHHHAVVRNGSVITYYIDGISSGTYTTSANITGTASVRIGEYSATTGYSANGYISNLRIVKGTAVYTANFTPPTSALTAISGTQLLCLQGTTPFVDNSTNAFTINTYSGVTANSLGPFFTSAGKGGLVWTKTRNGTENHLLYSTPLGTGGTGLISNDPASNTAYSSYNNISSFNSNGFTLGIAGSGNQSNPNGTNAVSWTFAKQPKFFDIVTYTGNGSNRTISHNLGSVPGMIIVKSVSQSSNWQVYHRSNANTQYMVLNSTAAVATGTTRWNSTTPTSTVFSIGTDSTVNTNGATYIAYLFAHNAGGFGTTGTDNVISCGSFIAGSTPITLDWEPQYILVKSTTTTGDANFDGWMVFDSMRSFGTFTTTFYTVNAATLRANTSAAEVSGAGDYGPRPLATGFNWFAYNGTPFIYMAIRRPMAVPTVGTSVFMPVARTGTGSSNTVVTAGFPVDMFWNGIRNFAGEYPAYYDRLRGNDKILYSNATIGEFSTASVEVAFNTSNANTGITLGVNNNQINGSGVLYVDHFFRRASGFFDEVCYTGTGSSTTQAHNLGVVPELIICKIRSGSSANWVVWNTTLNSSTGYLYLNADMAASNFAGVWNGAPTSTYFTLGTNYQNNESGSTFVAYLFATCAGVSKVGSYTGTGATQTINCGFTGGARFVLIKRTDSTGDWYVWDTARGMVSGTDPSLLLNSTAAEVNANSIYTATTGFQIVSTAAGINASGGTYIFLAIA